MNENQKTHCSRRRTALVLVVTAVAGLLIWVAIAAITGRREAWDSSLYVLLGLPTMFLLAGVAGFICPNVRGVAGIAVVSLQFVALLMLPPSNLGPLAWFGGGAFFMFFAALCTGGTVIGVALRQRQRRS